MIPKNLPPVYGSLSVVPGFVDFHAQHNPDRPWAIFPSDTSPSGTSSISFQEFAHATHRVAHHVRPERQGNELEVVVIVAHTDAVLYVSLLAGMMRAGVIPFPLSPKTSPEAIKQFMKKTSAHRIITQDVFRPVFKKVQRQLGEEGFNIDIEILYPWTRSSLRSTWEVKPASFEEDATQ
ncbi:hypothetical protein BDY19DRAFT_994681 [Irpex rosettiformis]|uniref:Uncharacterized protein n=1 Tax=Irpex rosettiformis TaxID=378272 RepID=A0ACB8U138_9APHY|nr:hypothetical protein BDY19DRAFT_994681 [Irpex rosettiformis]